MRWMIGVFLFAFEAIVLAAIFTKAPTPLQFPVGGPKIKLADNLSCTECETGPFYVDALATMHVDCDGACTVQLVCRPGGSRHDAILATIQTIDAAAQMEPNGICDNAMFQVLACDPTPESPACRIRGWLY